MIDQNSLKQETIKDKLRFMVQCWSKQNRSVGNIIFQSNFNVKKSNMPGYEI